MVRPMNDSAGTSPGFSSKTSSTQAFCNVVNRDGSASGNPTLNLAMSASVPCGTLG